MDGAPKQAVFLISSREEGNKRFGTGFVIHHDKNRHLLLTCRHVLEKICGKEISKEKIDIGGKIPEEICFNPEGPPGCRPLEGERSCSVDQRTFRNREQDRATDTACTQALWRAVMEENPSQFKGDDFPVEGIGWDGAMELIERLNTLTADLDLRLPTEAEWEYGCRAGTTTPFSFGDNIKPDQAQYNHEDSY